MEIVPQLMTRQKWLYQKENLKVGDIMVEIEEKSPRGFWKKVRVTKIIPSKDSFVRRVEIIDSAGRTYTRPITCMVPLRI